MRNWRIGRPQNVPRHLENDLSNFDEDRGSMWRGVFRRRTVVKVWEVQHEISNAGLSHNVSQIERLIKRRFGLE